MEGEHEAKHDPMRRLDQRGIGYATSADNWRRPPPACRRTSDHDEGDVVRDWAEVNCVPDDGSQGGRDAQALSPSACASVKGALFADGEAVRHFCTVTNRSTARRPAPDGVVMNELAGAALLSQKFGANVVWLRLNVMLYNLLSAFHRVGAYPMNSTMPAPSASAGV